MAIPGTGAHGVRHRVHHCSQGLTIPLIFWTVQTTEDTWLAALIQACGPLIAGLFACGFIWHQRLVGWAAPHWRDVRQAYSDGWHIFLSTAAISLYTNTNSVLLGLMTNHTAVGLFSAADKIRLACQGLITPFSSAVYPRVSALVAQSPQAGLALVRKVLFIQGGLTFILSCGLWLLAPWIVQFIMGTQFDAGGERTTRAIPPAFSHRIEQCVRYSDHAALRPEKVL